MRRYWVLALAVLTLVAGLAPPAFAQAPTPKVTISGLFDLVTSWASNKSGTADSDPTRRETDWYSRERGRLDFIGELGKAKMVWGIELDFTNGENAHAGTSAGFDLDTDIAGVVETKWLYLEFPFTGKGSLLPFIDVPSTLRGGGQPFVGHDYKAGGVLASGDFGGVNLVTTFAPNLKNTLTYVQIEERNQKAEAGARENRRESWAILESLEFSPTKELTAKPTFSFTQLGGVIANAILNTPGRGGFVGGGSRVWRATIGGDARWTSGPWSLQPTFHYQFGEQVLRADNIARVQDEVDIDAWIFDVIGGWRSGPLNLEARFVYTSGNDADECVQSIPAATGATCRGGSDINYFNPINTGFTYFFGWSEFFTSATEYNTTFLGANQALRRGTAIGFDKYGLIAAAVRATYALTPALSLVGLVSPSWTAEDVDTNGAVATATGITPTRVGAEARPRGDEDYIGTEVSGGFTYRFAPGLVFDARYGHLFAGDALNQCGAAACVRPRESKDVDVVNLRVRYTF